MSYSLIISTNADEDIVESINWYNGQKESLGFKFYERVNEKLDLLVKSPFHYAIRFRKIRALQVHGFPYLIYFKIIEAQSSYWC